MPPPRANRLRDKFQQAQAFHQQGRLADAGAIYQDILRLDPRHADALHFLGLIALQTKQASQGVRLIEKAITLKPKYAEAYGNLGIGYADLGRHQDALVNYDKALALRPDMANVHDNRGNTLRDLKLYEASVASHDRAIALRPNDAGAFSNRGNALRDLRRHDEALASYDQAIALEAGFFEARCNRAIVLQALGRYCEALVDLDEVIATVSGYAEAYNAKGNVLQELLRHEDALASFDKAIALKQDYAEAHNNRGNALRDLIRYEEAASSYARAVAFKPDFPEAHNNLGNALRDLRQYEEAVSSYIRAIGMKPDYAEAYSNLGNALHDLHKDEDSLDSFAKAIALKPDHAGAYYGRGLALRALRRYREALASYEQALALEPGMPWLWGDVLFAKRQLCDWISSESLLARLQDRIELGQKVSTPFILTALSASPALQKKAAEIFTRGQYPANDELPAKFDHAGHAKIRIGYFSADFHEHATMHLMIGLFERHDRSKFELIAFSFGSGDQDALRQRAVGAFDQFNDVRSLSDRDTASLARKLEIDIAVDLKGSTLDCRSGIFAYRAAPVQVSYLGYPGTMGANYIDYIIADRVLIPPGTEEHYTEKIVSLPNSYQVNNRHRPISRRTFTRAEQGLPEVGFVFCCFNNNYKITPQVFESWMRILTRVEGSILWLYEENPDAAANLRQEAVARGVAVERLVFASRLPVDDHLARHRLADLFLDTLPYNAHTTGSDALWTGLPVLTRIGETFAGRVAASLLNAIGLPELITTTLDAYEALAVELATCPDALRAFKTKLQDNRLTTPLFDTALFTRHLEAAYTALHRRARAGLPPTHIHIESNLDALQEPATVRRKETGGGAN